MSRPAPIRIDHPFFDIKSSEETPAGKPLSTGRGPGRDLRLLRSAEGLRDDEPRQLWLSLPGAEVSPDIADFLRALRPRRGPHRERRAIADVIGLQRRGLSLDEAVAAVAARSALERHETKLLRRRVGCIQHAVTRQP